MSWWVTVTLTLYVVGLCRKFQLSLPYSFTFRGTVHFKTGAPNDPQITFKSSRSKVQEICYTSLRVPTLILLDFDPRSAVFELRHFETSAPDDPKNDQNYLKAKRTNLETNIFQFYIIYSLSLIIICFWNTINPVSQISVRFTVQCIPKVLFFHLPFSH